MTVYVDDMRAQYGRLVLCHLLATDDAELHAMADTIGVSRRWWQRSARGGDSHYDICLTKRALAIQNGAVPITMRQASAMNARRRITGSLGVPTDAEAWLKQYYRSQSRLTGQ